MRILILTGILFWLAANVVSQPVVPPPPQTDEIIIDATPTGTAEPGDRIRYKVQIQNTGSAAATLVQLNVVLDPRTTLVPGSFKTSPLAFNDAYAVTGNVGINVPAANGLLINDFDDNIAGLTINAGTFATTQGGSIMVVADGSFMYTPPAGFTGTDTYVYTLNDGNGVGGGVPATDMGTVTFTLNNLIWFINNSAGAGDGRLNTPFNTLTAFNAGSATAGDVVYIEHTGTNYTGGIVLQANERLFGEGHTGAANLSGVLPFSLAMFSKALPNINGTRPVITNAAGDGILLSTGNTIRGLDVGASSDFAIDDNGSVGTLTISEVSVNNITGGGFRTDNGGTLAVTLGSLTSTGGANGINLSGTGGSFTVSGATSITNPTGIGLAIASTAAGASANFAAITVGGSSSHGIELNGNTGTFSASGLTTINSPAAGANISLHITGGTGSISFANLDINGRRDKGIRISGGSRNITTGAIDIDNPNVSTTIGLEINAPTGGTIGLGATTINNGGANGSAVEIQSTSAVVTFTGGSAISNSAAHEFFVNGGAANITYNGTLTSTTGVCVAINGRTGGTTSFTGNISSTGAGIGIAAGNNTGGTIEFTGASKAITSSAANGVSLTSNTGATINFTNGGLVINTTSGVGFNATGGGTITVQGSGNTINATTGPANTNTNTALNVANTTIGAGNLIFVSISSGNNTAAADPANGIVLNSTGVLGGLTITGTGAANSGGRLQNMIGADNSGTTPGGTSIVLNSTANVSLKYMLIHDNSNYAIRGNSVTNFRFENSTINGINGTNVSSPFRDSGIRLDGCSGMININNNEITGGYQHNVLYDTQSGTTNLNFIGNNVHHTNPATGDDGFQLEAELTAVVFANVSNNTFTAHGGDHFNLTMINNANVDLTFKNNDMQGGHAIGLGQGILLFGASHNGTFKYDISNNGTLADPFIGNRQGGAIHVNKGSGTATFSGQIVNNVIGNPSITASGSLEAFGIIATARGAGGSHKTLIQGNTVREYFDRGIVLEAGEGAPSFTASLLNNSVSDFADATNSLHGIHCEFGILGSDNAQITIDVRNNLIANAGNEPQGGVDFRMRTAGSNDVFIGGCGTCTTAATTQAYIDGQNPDGTTFLVSLVGGGVPPATYNNGPAVPFSLPNLPTLPPAP